MTSAMIGSDRIIRWSSSRHKTLNQCWFNVLCLLGMYPGPCRSCRAVPHLVMTGVTVWCRHMAHNCVLKPATRHLLTSLRRSGTGPSGNHIQLFLAMTDRSWAWPNLTRSSDRLVVMGYLGADVTRRDAATQGHLVLAFMYSSLQSQKAVSAYL